ncbi:MAG: nucleotidyltransferase [Candidatus Omnitrophica bacterium]|nr:nucleotidyltransferase [Candidatus Omnitrophota bacterium]
MNFTVSKLKKIIRLLSSEKIEYAILGGIAVLVYGEPRFTADIDINIIFDRKRVGELVRAAKKHNIFPVARDSKKIAEKTGVLCLKLKEKRESFFVDIIIAENMLEFSAIKRSRLKKIDSIKARFVSPEDLVIHKITGARAHDFDDLQSVLRRQKGKLDLRYITKWLKKIDVANGTSLRKEFKQLIAEARK